MVLDSDGIACQRVNFNIGASTTSTRSWDIYVTQYTCGQEDLGGPPGCLQYYTSTTGLVKKYDHSPIKIRKGFHSLIKSNLLLCSFGFPTSYTGAAAVPASTTHLQNQNYNVCVRRSKGMCYICWASWYYDSNMGSFGLSISADDNAAQALMGTSCTLDYLVVSTGCSSKF